MPLLCLQLRRLLQTSVDASVSKACLDQGFRAVRCEMWFLPNPEGSGGHMMPRHMHTLE